MLLLPLLFLLLLWGLLLLLLLLLSALHHWVLNHWQRSLCSLRRFDFIVIDPNDRLVIVIADRRASGLTWCFLHLFLLFPLFSLFLHFFCCYSFCPFWLSKSTSACKTFAILILFWVRFQFASATNFRFIATFRGFHKFSSQRFVSESFRHHTQTHLSCGLRVLYRVFSLRSVLSRL